MRSEQEPLWTALPGSHAVDWGPLALQIWLESEHRRQPKSSRCDVSTHVLTRPLNNEELISHRGKTRR